MRTIIWDAYWPRVSCWPHVVVMRTFYGSSSALRSPDYVEYHTYFEGTFYNLDIWNENAITRWSLRTVSHGTNGHPAFNPVEERARELAYMLFPDQMMEVLL